MIRTGLTAFRWGWTAFVVVLTSAPYVLNWWSTPAGFHYTWILPPYPEDSFGYMAWAQQAAHGAWLFKIKYTALPHAGFLFHPLFLICGWISALFSCDIGVVFWIAKAIGVVLFLVTFYRYIDYLGLNTVQSVAASILIGVSSGLGGILAFLNVIAESSVVPADLSMPEMSTFWSLLWNPLFPFSLTLMLLSIFWLDRGTREKCASDLWRSGLAAGVMSLLHPYSLPVLFALAMVITIVRNRANAVGYLFRYFATSLPFAIYLAVVSRINPIVSRHSVLGEMKSVPVAAYALGFGLPLLLCVAGLILARETMLKRYWHLAVWFLLSVALAYVPFWFQRKLIFGAHIPLCIMGGVAFDLILARWPAATRKWAVLATAAIFLPLLAATPVYLLVSQDREVKANEDGAYFLSNDMAQALKVLKERSKPDEVVFATLATSRVIPAFAGNTVVWGHWAMSIDQHERDNWLRNLFNSQSNLNDARRSREFWGNDIQFIFADGELKQSMEQYPDAWSVILKDARKIFENDSVVIYQRQNI
jgi:hypothetical protein